MEKGRIYCGKEEKKMADIGKERTKEKRKEE